MAAWRVGSRVPALLAAVLLAGTAPSQAQTTAPARPAGPALSADPVLTLDGLPRPAAPPPSSRLHQQQALCGDGGGGGFGAFAICAIMRHHMRAGLSQYGSGGRANTLGRAGEQDGLARKINRNRHALGLAYCLGLAKPKNAA
jgi:hypothetical protein